MGIAESTRKGWNKDNGWGGSNEKGDPKAAP
jgi:hypothetical protein